MAKTKAFEMTCPHCQQITLIPATMEDYSWGGYYSKPKRFCCIHCQGYIEVKAHRGIIDIEEC